MSLYDDVLSGLLISSSALPMPNPIDTVSIIAGGVLVGLGDWWRQPTDARAGLFRPVYGKLERAGGGWRLTGRPDGIDVNLLPPETPEEAALLTPVLNARRYFKAEYLAVLSGHLADASGLEAEGLREWIRQVEKLEPLTSEELLKIPARRVGRLLLAQDGEVVSMLLFDETGDYDTFGESDTWLEAIGALWAENPVDMRAFQQMVREKTPYGPRTIYRIDSLTSEGPLAALAHFFHHTTV